MQEKAPQRDGLKALTILRERILRLEMSPGSVIDDDRPAQRGQARSAIRPPSIGSSAPVTQRDSSEAR